MILTCPFPGDKAIAKLIFLINNLVPGTARENETHFPPTTMNMAVFAACSLNFSVRADEGKDRGPVDVKISPLRRSSMYNEQRTPHDLK